MTATTFPDCTAAATNKHWGGYHANCEGCTIRALAHGLAFYQARRARDIVPAYKKALESSFGEGWEAGHEKVKAESKRLVQMEGANHA